MKGTIVTVEGPRFSTRAESLMFRAWGADVINMTTVPEVRELNGKTLFNYLRRKEKVIKFTKVSRDVSKHKI